MYGAYLHADISDSAAYLRRDYRKAMLDVAKTCREIADLVGEGVA